MYRFPQAPRSTRTSRALEHLFRRREADSTRRGCLNHVTLLEEQAGSALQRRGRSKAWAGGGSHPRSQESGKPIGAHRSRCRPLLEGNAPHSRAVQGRELGRVTDSERSAALTSDTQEKRLDFGLKKVLVGRGMSADVARCSADNLDGRYSTREAVTLLESGPTAEITGP
jgi:hypothetical protein